MSEHRIAYANANESFWFDARAKCRKCGRFVSWSEVGPIKYYAASGWNGEVIDGHSSHPACGDRVEIDVAYRPVHIHGEVIA